LGRPLEKLRICPAKAGDLSFAEPRAPQVTLKRQKDNERKGVLELRAPIDNGTSGNGLLHFGQICDEE
jgi:hypothetical protein